MAINAEIPLMVKTPDTATPLMQFADRQLQKKQEERLGRQEERLNKSQDLRDQLTAEQIAQQKFETLTERDQARVKDVLIGGAELNQHLRSGDLSGAISMLNQRKARLGERIAAGENIDTADTDAAIAVLNSGDETKIKQLSTMLDQGEKFGQMMGFFEKPQAANGAASSVGKLEQDYKEGLISKEVYDAAVKKETGASKPMPAAAVKMQNEALDIIGTASSINADLGAITKQIDDGTLEFGPIDNAWNAGRNKVGMSSENSRNFASFKSSLEKLRNDSLRLNKGVQTDGDAQRAWNELLQDINDTQLVKQRLQEIQKINERGAALQKLNLDNIRANYGNDPLDTTAYEQQAPAVGGGGQPAGSASAQETPRQRLERLRAAKAQKPQ